jgi:excinuclease ABC subunit C|tara:strand:- start:25397 stop:26638 length:1242 start_codon:yes stop_codon:yes gene_type:complete
MWKFIKKENLGRLPKAPGVYCFKNKSKKFLYIGKSSNLKERVKSHFRQPSPKDSLLIKEVKRIGFIETDSEIEALILEANLIKKYQPKHNVVWRDDKRYFYVAITKGELPIVFITHQPKTNYIGPFTEGKPLKKALRFLRKIFPYYVVKKHPKVPCIYCHLGICPGPNPNKKEYKENIRNLILVLSGKKKSVVSNLKKEMGKWSKEENFEKALETRNQIIALENIFEHAKILSLPQIEKLPQTNWPTIENKLKKILKTKQKISRIEAYDVSNIQGELATGSAITFIKGLPDKNFYRKFKIKITGKPNDTAMLKECLRRRLKHKEWPYPDLILIDGGKGQLNAAKSVLNNKIKLIALAKRNNELYIKGKKNPVLLKDFSKEIFNLILQLRDEAHRFAKSYHKKLRRKSLIDSSI